MGGPRCGSERRNMNGEEKGGKFWGEKKGKVAGQREVEREEWVDESRWRKKKEERGERKIKNKIK